MKEFPTVWMTAVTAIVPCLFFGYLGIRQFLWPERIRDRRIKHLQSPAGLRSIRAVGAGFLIFCIIWVVAIAFVPPGGSLTLFGYHYVCNEQVCHAAVQR